MAGAFGQVSGSFGNASNSSNPFASNTMGSTIFPNSMTQGSVFGGNATNVFGAPSSSSFGNSSVSGTGSNSSNLFALKTMRGANFPSSSTQGSFFGNSTTNAFGAPLPSSMETSSVFGTTSNSSNLFAPSTTGSISFPSSSTQGSFFGNSTTNVFGAPFPSSMETSSVFGTTSNSSNLFAPSTVGNINFPSSSTQESFFGKSTTNAFGAPLSSSQGSFFGNNTTNAFGVPSSSSLGTSNVFGQASNSSNLFAPNSTMGSTNFPNSSSHGSAFGNSTSGVYGSASSSSFPSVFGNPISSSNLFASTTTGSTNFPCFLSQPTQGSVFGNTTASIFGAALPSSYPSVFGNPSSLSLPTQGSVFGGSATNVFGAPSSSSFGTSSVLGNASSSSNLFAPTTMGTTNVQGLTTKGSVFGGSSTGVFGAPSASSPSCMFGQPTSFFGSSSLIGTTSIGSHGPFGSITSTGASGGLSSAGHCLVASDTPILSSSIFGVSSSSFLTSPSTLSVLQPCYQNTGSRVRPYEHVIIEEDVKKGGLITKEKVKLISISAMPLFESKSHEELRWEDYKLKSGGQLNSISKQAPGFNEPKFNFPLPPVTSSSPDSSFILTGCDRVTTNTLNNQPLQNTQSPPQAMGLWSNNLSETAISSPVTHSPCTILGFDQVTAKPWPYNGNIFNPTMQAPVSSTAPPVSAGNNGGVSLDVGSPQPSLPQQFTGTDNVMVSITAVKDPFGSEPATSRQSIFHSAYSSLVQHGISSMPVSNKPVKTRVSSYFTSRHHSLKPLAVNGRKYRPSSDGPKKVPFFDRGEEIQNTSKASCYILPRENPRSVLAASTEQTHVSTSRNVAYLLNHAFAVVYEDGEDNAKKAPTRNFTPNSVKDHLSLANDNAKEVNEPLIPKLQRCDYYTEPKIDKLASMESLNPGFCCHVKDFIVGRDGYGWVKFHGETNVRGLDLDSLIQFNYREVIVYNDASEKPPVGQGLNKAAEVTLLNVKCIDKTGKQYTGGKMVDKYIEKLKQAAKKQGAEFVSYDPVKGEWKFSVQHF